MPNHAQQLLTLGQSVWLDFIRRGHLLSGGFDHDVKEAGVVGVTSNPTIFQQAIGGSTDYDAPLAEESRAMDFSAPDRARGLGRVLWRAIKGREPPWQPDDD